MKKLKTEELQMFDSNVKSRIRGYKHLIMTELESAGCTDMYFEIVRYECFLSSYIKFGFKFREKYFCGELHFSENRSVGYKCRHYDAKYTNIELQMCTKEEHAEKKYLREADFKIYDIRKNLREKFLEKMNNVDLLPVYRKVKEMHRDLVKIFN